MSDHTEAPWRVESNDARTLIMGVRGEVICDTSEQETEAEARANNRLIAAAPELLAALRVIVERWDSDEIGQVDGEFIDDARIAIAKAEVKP